MKIHEIEGYIQTIYLVEENGSFFLLDGCCRPDVDVVEAYITKKLGREFKDLKLVIATHPHPDHFGGLSFFKKRGISIAGPEKINIWYKGFSGLMTYLVEVFLTYLVALNKKKGMKKILFPRKVELDYALSEGREIPGFSDWKVMECPGHTPMDLTIYHSEKKMAYIADNFISAKSGVFCPYPIFDPAKYKESLNRYIDSDIEEYMLAHRGRMKIKKEQIERIRDKISLTPRRHTNTLPKIFLKLFKVMIK
jgi:glyoxylase-like metal-dependent hydrolase (beta-lactamase superfamily II)